MIIILYLKGNGAEENNCLSCSGDKFGFLFDSNKTCL
jgi:hypothetical protein